MISVCCHRLPGAVSRWMDKPRLVSWAQLAMWTIAEAVIIALGEVR